jgi:hypothetical protein
MGRYSVLTQPLSGFKKVVHKTTGECCIVELVIPAGATVHFSLFTNKCRASCATVVACSQGTFVSHYDPSVEYAVGATVIPSNGFATEEECDAETENLLHYTQPRDAKHTCASGIHFFLDERSARQYNLV